jgi:hypothetical protein
MAPVWRRTAGRILLNSQGPRVSVVDRDNMDVSLFGERDFLGDSQGTPGRA